MYCVYCLISKKNPKFHYYGYTADLEQRVKVHQAGKVRTTKRFLPVGLLGYKVFDSELEARAFEKKLKTSAAVRERFVADLVESQAHLPAGRQVT